MKEVDRIPDQSHRRDGHRQSGEKAPTLSDQRAFFLFKWPQLPRVRDRVADIFERLQQVLGARDARVVFDQRLFVRQAHRDFVHTRLPAQRLLNSAGAEGTVEPANACADSAATGDAGRLFAPEMRGGFNGDNSVHGSTLALLTCGRCGCAYTAEIKKERYTYYRCTSYRGACGNTYIRERLGADRRGPRRVKIAQHRLGPLSYRRSSPPRHPQNTPARQPRDGDNRLLDDDFARAARRAGRNEGRRILPPDNCRAYSNRGVSDPTWAHATSPRAPSRGRSRLGSRCPCRAGTAG